MWVIDKGSDFYFAYEFTSIAWDFRKEGEN